MDSNSYIPMYPSLDSMITLFFRIVKLVWFIFDTMMSTMTIIDIVMRCVKLDAQFLVNKPLDSVTTHNLWQFLDLGDRKIEIIRNFFQG